MPAVLFEIVDFVTQSFVVTVQVTQFHLDGCDRSIRAASVLGISLVYTMLYAIQHTVFHKFLRQRIGETLVSKEFRH